MSGQDSEGNLKQSWVDLGSIVQRMIFIFLLIVAYGYLIDFKNQYS